MTAPQDKALADRAARAVADLAAARLDLLRTEEALERGREGLAALHAYRDALEAGDPAGAYRALAAAVTAQEEALALKRPARPQRIARLLDALLLLVDVHDDPDRLGARLLALRLRLLADA